MKTTAVNDRNIERTVMKMQQSPTTATGQGWRYHKSPFEVDFEGRGHTTSCKPPCKQPSAVRV